MYLEPEQYKKAAWIIYGGGVFLLAALYFFRIAWNLLKKKWGKKLVPPSWNRKHSTRGVHEDIFHHRHGAHDYDPS